MDLGQLRYFLKICEHRSFTVAAQDCEVSQPALSQQIAKLEKELGHALFERNGRTIRLTSAGKILHNRAEKILELVDDAKRQITDDGEHGLITIGAIPTVAPYLLPDLLSLVGSQFQMANFQIYEQPTGKLTGNCLNGQIDFALLSLPCHPKQLTLETLFCEELKLALPIHHPLATKTKIRLVDLIDQSFILLGNSHCLSENIVDYLSARNFRTKIAAEVEQLSTLKKLVETGIGISFVPQMATCDGMDRIVYRSISGDKPTRKIALGYKSNRYLGQLLSNFGKALREFANFWQVNNEVTQKAKLNESRPEIYL